MLLSWQKEFNNLEERLKKEEEKVHAYKGQLEEMRYNFFKDLNNLNNQIHTSAKPNFAYE
jgi:hypothetical protein